MHAGVYRMMTWNARSLDLVEWNQGELSHRCCLASPMCTSMLLRFLLCFHRDLTGRRIRQAQVVTRIKEWMEKKRKEDALVAALTQGVQEKVPVGIHKGVTSVSVFDPFYLLPLYSRLCEGTFALVEEVCSLFLRCCFTWEGGQANCRSR